MSGLVLYDVIVTCKMGGSRILIILVAIYEHVELLTRVGH